MATLTFQPANITITVESGTSLLDVASQAGVHIHAPCGGEGACGECRVRVIEGRVERVSRGCLSHTELEDGWILACGSRVAGDATLVVPQIQESHAQIVTEGNEEVFSLELSPLVHKVHLEVEKPSLDNSFSDLERISRSLSPAVDLTTSLEVLQQLAGTLREQNHHITLSLYQPSPNQNVQILQIEPGDTSRLLFGIAIDIGTTTCAVHLVNLHSNHILGTTMDYNRQITRGNDIISRINYARTPKQIEELRNLVLDNLNHLIQTLCREHEVNHKDIMSAVIAGNTTMIHLFLGLNPDYIRLDPYTPTVNAPPNLQAREVGLMIHPRGIVQIAPGVGSYVGGDITAGLLMTPLAEEGHEEICLFLDIGTNGEVVIGNSEWLIACAASAGPAFEGSGVSCGMRAAHGAIERVRIHSQNHPPEIRVIGGGKPRGICGSGMIDLLAELWSHDILDSSGKLNRDLEGNLVQPCNDSIRYQAYCVVQPDDSYDGKGVYIDERDIQNLLRTKAAVYSACALMVKSVGLDFDSIDQVFVAGGFGRFLDLEKSIQVGLLPDLPRNKFIYLGNSALSGAKAMLSSEDARRRVYSIAHRMTYLELNVDPSYMDEYMAAMFLPHTDLHRFPTVIKGVTYG